MTTSENPEQYLLQNLETGFAYPQSIHFGKRLPTSGQILLVVAGDCYVCSSRRWNPEEVLARSSDPVVILYWTDRSEVKNLASLRRAWVIFDPKQTLLPNSFSYRAPIPYLVDVAKSQLVKLPRDGETVNDFVEQAETSHGSNK